MIKNSVLSQINVVVKFSSTISNRTISQLAEHKKDTPIIPKFYTRNDAIDTSRFIIDCHKYDMSEQPEEIPELRLEILKKFKEIGVVMLKNTNLGNDLEKMSEWAKVPMGKVNKYEGGANQRKELVKNVYDVGVPMKVYLHYHHEMAYVNQSISMLAFCAKSVLKPTLKDPYRGATFLSDNVKATDDILKTSFGQKLRELGVCYIRCLADRETVSNSGVHNFWQTSFMTDSSLEVERLATQKGLNFSWGPGRYFRTKYYTSAYEYFPPLNRNLFFVGLSHHSCKFDSWDGIREKPEMPDFESASPDHRPINLLFGDDSKMTRDDLELLVDVYDRNGFPLAWEQGDVGIFCNYRFAHGKPSFGQAEGENRELGVLLGPMFDRIGQLEGKW